MEKQANDSSRKANLKPRERTESSNAIVCPPSSGEDLPLSKSLAERHEEIKYWQAISAIYFIPEKTLQAKIKEILK